MLQPAFVRNRARTTRAAEVRSLFFADLMLPTGVNLFHGLGHGVWCNSYLIGKKKLGRRLCVCHLQPQMTLNARMAYVGIQLWACEYGEINTIICPYCGELNAKGYSLCCKQLAKACAAVLARVGSQQNNELVASV
jgi:hypothetical protein